MTNKKKIYTIDLSEDNVHMFDSFAIKKNIVASHNVINEFKEELLDGGMLARFALGFMESINYFNIPQEYLDEIRLWKEVADLDDWVFLGNAAYEVYCASEVPLSQHLFTWCSSSATYTRKYGTIHMRNLDWPLDHLRRSTVIVKYINAAAGDFTSVTVPGFSGVLSGVAKGRFSAAININAVSEEFNRKGTPTSFILREAFEKCPNYESALEFIFDSLSAAPTFVHLTGPKKCENHIIELNPKDNNYCTPWPYRPIRNNGVQFRIAKNHPKIVAVTNHSLLDTDYCDEDYNFDSAERLRKIKLWSKDVKSPFDAMAVLKKSPIHYEDTKQSIVLLPRSGEVFLE